MPGGQYGDDPVKWGPYVRVSYDAKKWDPAALAGDYLGGHLTELGRQHLIVLDGATEDYCGLWEVAWAIDTKNPGMGIDRARQEARDASLDLLREGLIGVYLTDEYLHPIERLTGQEAEETLTREENWLVPEAALRYALTSTEEGDRALWAAGDLLRRYGLIAEGNQGAPGPT